jgi:hypothetical protein
MRSFLMACIKGGYVETANKNSSSEPPIHNEDNMIVPAILISLIVFGMPIIGSLSIILHWGE